MKFIEYNPVDEKGGCIARALSKAYNKNYNDIKEELNNIAQKLSFNDYREIAVFEDYLLNNKATILNDYNQHIVKDLKLYNGIYVVFCNEGDFYHLVTIIDDVMYDKHDSAFNLKVLKMYKVNK